MEVLSVVCIIMLFLCGLINIFIEAYHLVNKFKKFNRIEQFRAQVHANRFREQQRFRVRINRRQNQPQ